MNAFLLERLQSTGWRRANELYWRLSDATDEADRLIASGQARAVRVLSVDVELAAIYSTESRETVGAVS